MLDQHFLNGSKSCLPPTPSSITTYFLPQATSNLITNNPFVPKNNGSLNKAKNPTGPQSIANKSQVLQKYLQFKSIAIINKKKYFSIFNKRTNKSFWISEGETVENFRVTYYNPTNNTISITDGINTEIIPIITANETPLSVASGPTSKKGKRLSPQIPGAKANQNKDKRQKRLQEDESFQLNARNEKKNGGAGRNRTDDRGFAVLGLTTWRPRLTNKYS